MVCSFVVRVKGTTTATDSRRSAGPRLVKASKRTGIRGVTSSLTAEASAMPTQSSCPSVPKACDDGGAGHHGITFSDGVGSAVRHGIAFELDPTVPTGVDAVLPTTTSSTVQASSPSAAVSALIGTLDQLEVVVMASAVLKGYLFGEADTRRGVLSTIDASPSGAMPVPWAPSRTADHAVVAAWSGRDVMACGSCRR